MDAIRDDALDGDDDAVADAAAEPYDADVFAELLWPDEGEPSLHGGSDDGDGVGEQERSAEGGKAQRRQLDDLEAQLAKLQAVQRLLRSELGPEDAKPKTNDLRSSRLRSKSTEMEEQDGADGAAKLSHPVDARKSLQHCPAHFVCPITQEIFRYPVIASDGHSYERGSIETWIATDPNVTPTSPVTNLPLPTVVLFPNYGLRSLILEWREKEGLPPDDEYADGDAALGGGRVSPSKLPSDDPYAGLSMNYPRQLTASATPALRWDEGETDDEHGDEGFDPDDPWLAEALRRPLVAICVEIDEFCIKNDGFCIENEDFNTNVQVFQEVGETQVIRGLPSVQSRLPATFTRQQEEWTRQFLGETGHFPRGVQLQRHVEELARGREARGLRAAGIGERLIIARDARGGAPIGGGGGVVDPDQYSRSVLWSSVCNIM